MVREEKSILLGKERLEKVAAMEWARGEKRKEFLLSIFRLDSNFQKINAGKGGFEDALDISVALDRLARLRGLCNMLLVPEVTAILRDLESNSKLFKACDELVFQLFRIKGAEFDGIVLGNIKPEFRQKNPKSFSEYCSYFKHSVESRELGPVLKKSGFTQGEREVVYMLGAAINDFVKLNEKLRSSIFSFEEIRTSEQWRDWNFEKYQQDNSMQWLREAIKNSDYNSFRLQPRVVPENYNWD